MLAAVLLLAGPALALQQLLITAQEESSNPVFEVYSAAADRVTTVEKQLGVGRAGAGAGAGLARVVERQLLVQYRAGTGEAWLLSSLPAGLTGAANTQFGDSVCSVGGWNETARAASGAVLCWNPLSRAGGQQERRTRPCQPFIMQTN